MKIVVNKCFGGFSLSAMAVKRIAELQGKPAYFFKREYEGLKPSYIPVDIEDCKKTVFFSAFTVPNPNEYLTNKDWHEMTKEEKDEQGKKYDEIYLSDRPENRTDKFLLRVVKELGKEANGACADLKIIKIPDDVDWEIDEYDGMETVQEKHRSW